ncbi:MAG TPA: hypothetical protein IAA02_08915 [Candidatus Sutterella merdavium]|nr:hypothetical protein [Candidatus Sutterella merdavium]
MTTILSSVHAFFAAAAAGCLLATAFGELRRAGTNRLTALTLAALAATLAAAAALVSQFGRPALLFSVFSNPGTAIFRELASLLLAHLAGAAYLAALLTGATRRTAGKLSLLAALSGLLLALATGSAAVQPWRPVWNTWTLVLPTAGFAWLAGVMLAKSLGAAGHESAGPALSVLKKAEEKTGETASEPLWESTRLAALAPLVGLACYFAAASTDASARTALASLLTGANAWLFWAGVIVPSVLLSFLAAQFASDTLKRNPVLGIALATLSAFAAGAWQHLVLGLA